MVDQAVTTTNEDLVDDGTTEIDPSTGKRRKRRTFQDLSDTEKKNLLDILSLLKFLLGAEDAETGRDGDVAHNPLFQSLDKRFADALGMDPAGDDYAGLKQRVRAPNYDPAKDPSFVDRAARNGGLQAGGRVDNFARSGSTVLDLIAAHESGGNYNVVWSGCKQKPQNLSGMTVQEVMDWQRDEIARGSKSTAAGRYQIISSTMKGLVAEMKRQDPNFDPATAKFDAALQDKMAIMLLKRRGLDDYMSGRMSQEKFLDNISKEWASIQNSSGKCSYNDGLNAAAKGSGNAMLAALSELKANGSFNNASSGTMVASADTKADPSRKPGGPALTPTGNA